jgi:glycerophosphoryl diester phosphodiesterase
MQAFDLALEQGADAIEFDVRYLRDGTYIVFHNPTIQRRALHRMTVERVQQLLSSTRGNSTVGANIPPLLEEVLQRFSGFLKFNIEVKCEGIPTRCMISRLLEVIGQFDCDDEVLISSFNPLVLRFIQKASPRIQRGLLFTRQGLSLRISQMLANYSSLHPSIAYLSITDVREAHMGGVRVIPWTVNSEEDLTRCMKMGVDGIITDYPDRARRLIKG